MAAVPSGPDVSDEERLLAALQQFATNALQAKVQKVPPLRVRPRRILHAAHPHSALPAQDDRKHYSKIVEELGSRDVAVLQRWYTALAHCVSYISSRDTRELVSQVFAFSFARAGVALPAYLHFLLFLISANSEFLVPALKLLASNLLYREGTPR